MKREKERDMGPRNSFLRSPKKEEEQVPDAGLLPKLSQINHVCAHKESTNRNLMDELESILGGEDTDDDQNFPLKGNMMYGQLDWDFMNWEGLSLQGRGGGGEEEEEDDDDDDDDDDGGNEDANKSILFHEEESQHGFKRESYGLWDDRDDEKKVSLNLSLNYQEVLDAWSNRRSLWANDDSISMSANAYMGEVPILMEEERSRREASVLRYKEKRQTRLFSKKIRYQVRKLNADKRPRLKGRFVKRVSEKTLK